MFSHALTSGVVVDRDDFCTVVPCKVSNGEQDKLDRVFLREVLYAALTSMQNGKSPGMDGVPCELFKAMWYTIGDEWIRLFH